MDCEWDRVQNALAACRAAEPPTCASNCQRKRGRIRALASVGFSPMLARPDGSNIPKAASKMTLAAAKRKVDSLILPRSAWCLEWPSSRGVAELDCQTAMEPERRPSHETGADRDSGDHETGGS